MIELYHFIVYIFYIYIILYYNNYYRGRIQGGGDTSSALRILPDKLKTELALHVNLATLKKVFSSLPSSPLSISYFARPMRSITNRTDHINLFLLIIHSRALQNRWASSKSANPSSCTISSLKWEHPYSLPVIWSAEGEKSLGKCSSLLTEFLKWSGIFVFFFFFYVIKIDHYVRVYWVFFYVSIIYSWFDRHRAAARRAKCLRQWRPVTFSEKSASSI